VKGKQLVHAIANLEATQHHDIFLWKIKVELAGLKLKKKALVHAIAEAIGPAEMDLAVEAVEEGGPRITSDADRDRSEETRTLSHGEDTSEVSYKRVRSK